MVKLQNVIQGGADVVNDHGEIVGSVSRRYGSDTKAGWYAYGKDGKRISDDPSPKRDGAVREVLESQGVAIQVHEEVRESKEFKQWLERVTDGR